VKRLIVFDLDGTLAESKAAVDAEMAALLHRLLAAVGVAVLSGGDWPQFQEQLLSNLPRDPRLARLSLLPTCGTKLFQYDGDWQKRYSDDLASGEKARIVEALEAAIARAGFAAEKLWGETIEDRGSQITYSALGQEAPLDAKLKWDPLLFKRKQIKSILDGLLPDYSVRLGGTTSIDVTRPGIDKAYGVRKLRDLLGVSLAEMLFVGDALFEGGNDHPVLKAGVVSIAVRDPDETKRVIETILALQDATSLQETYDQHHHCDDKQKVDEGPQVNVIGPPEAKGP
jgi:phosphomannomutase